MAEARGSQDYGRLVRGIHVAALGGGGRRSRTKEGEQPLGALDAGTGRKPLLLELPERSAALPESLPRKTPLHLLTYRAVKYKPEMF